MTDLMTHRGPDDRGLYLSARIGLGHRRLSIIDVASGHQPMEDSERGRVICFNGEIFNFGALATSVLAPRGITLRTTSDTEVLLKLADFDDFRWLELLNGMFAFAVWDVQTQRLLLARDRLGVKPLYYTDVGSAFLFASEIKPLLAFPGVTREVNESKVPEYIAFRSVAGEETLFRTIRQVPPGHAVLIEPGRYEPRFIRYWTEGQSTELKDYADPLLPLEQQLAHILSDSVRLRLISEVPVGTYNSGGVDSSLVTALVRSHKADDLHTFSVGFNESTHDERPYADLVSRQYSTTHHALVVSASEYAQELDRALWHLEEPINHPHTVQLLLLSELAKKYVTVVLTGEGADELFGGYPRYNILTVNRLLGSLLPASAIGVLGSSLHRVGARRVSKLGDTLDGDAIDLLVGNSRCVQLRQLLALFPGEIDFHVRRALLQRSASYGLDELSQLLHYEQRTYLPSLLTRLDKMSMAASLEARVPFLDYRLVEWSYKLRAGSKIRRLQNKWLVKKVAEQWLPHKLIYRKKFGFDVPIASWFRTKTLLADRLDLLSDRSFRERGYFDNKIVRELVHKHLAGLADNSEVLWGLINFEMWHRLFIDDVRSSARLEPTAAPVTVEV